MDNYKYAYKDRVLIHVTEPIVEFLEIGNVFPLGIPEENVFYNFYVLKQQGDENVFEIIQKEDYKKYPDIVKYIKHLNSFIEDEKSEG